MGGGLDLLGSSSRSDRNSNTYTSPNGTRPRPSSPRSGGLNRRSSTGTPSADRSASSSAHHTPTSPRAGSAGTAGGSGASANNNGSNSGSQKDVAAEIASIQDTLEAQAMFVAALAREQQSIREAQEAMSQNMLFLNKNMVFMNGNISLLRERLEDLMDFHGVSYYLHVVEA